ncbi:heterokaryon incompatibility protein-domain-containing protein, partial [Halenospora varia]
MASRNTHNSKDSKRPRSPARNKDSLCHVCARIDFDQYLVHKISRDISLGSWSRLVQSDSCAFCRLVVRSLRKYSNQALLHPSDQIILNNEPSWELGIEISPYDRLKSEAYSNKLDLRSKAKRCPDVAHRFIVSCEEYPSRKAFLQCLAHGGQPREDRQFFGRMISRKQVDIDLLLSWLNRCDKWHEKVCEEDGIAGWRLPHELRLIDAKEMVIVMADPREVGYLTLSYVWGTEEMEAHNGMKPTVTNRKNIRTVNGEERTPLPKDLPRTIRDAILLTGCLGYRYLWVDALCIIQDDPQSEKIKHLDKMDAIYNCSEVTIVAASGRHADSGLPGISIPRASSQYSEKVNGLRLGTMAPSFSELEASSSLIWNTRGWTFQEKILAKRILLFTEHQVYFRCSEAIWTEEISLMLKMVMPQLNVDDQWTYLGMFPDYVSAVREYTQRTLTKPDDTLIAINGVFRTLQPDSGDFHFGLPSAYFLQALMWYPEPGSRIVRTNRDLPSWTWAGWQVERGITY